MVLPTEDYYPQDFENILKGTVISPDLLKSEDLIRS